MSVWLGEGFLNLSFESEKHLLDMFFTTVGQSAFWNAGLDPLMFTAELPSHIAVAAY